MTNVVCVKWGDKFSNDYVYRLKAGIERNTTRDITFTCLSDKEISGIHTIILKSGYHGWWNKLQLFDPATTLRNGNYRYVFFDLDTLITDSIDWLLDYDGEFMGIENLGINNHKYEDITKYKGVLQSGVMAWNSRACSDIWNYFEKHKEEIMKRFRGDGEFLHALIDKPDFIQHLYPEKLRSYKYECYDSGLPTETSIVCFHGQPSIEEAINEAVHPWGVTYEPREWVSNYWRL